MDATGGKGRAMKSPDSHAWSSCFFARGASPCTFKNPASTSTSCGNTSPAWRSVQPASSAYGLDAAPLALKYVSSYPKPPRPKAASTSRLWFAA